MSETTPTPTTQPNQETENPADLSQNLDEISDLQVAFGALAGLRAGDAHAATDKSNRKYDEVNHRLYEHRMQDSFGVPAADDSEEDGDEMGHKVRIRSPDVHHHHYPESPVPEPEPTPAPGPQPTPQPSPQPAQEQPTKTRTSLLPTIGAAVLGSGITLGGVMLNDYLSGDDNTPNVQPPPSTVQPYVDRTTRIEKWTPAPRSIKP